MQRPSVFPLGSGFVLLGTAMMLAGALGPWLGGRLLGGTHGVDLGGDGWLVIIAACLALIPLLLPLPPTTLRGVWVLVLAAAAGFVCWTHYSEAGTDGLQVVWGLELAAAGAAVAALGGVRLLRPTA